MQVPAEVAQREEHRTPSRIPGASSPDANRFRSETRRPERQVLDLSILVGTKTARLFLVGWWLGLATLTMGVVAMAQPARPDGPGGAASLRGVAIVLRDGTVFEVDELQNGRDHFIYRLGSIQGLLERSEVAGVRPIDGARTDADEPVQLNFTTGHRGLDRLIVEAATRHQIDPLLVFLVMREESGFNQRAISPTGARGLMQLMPATARQLGVRNINNPKENVEAGARHLQFLIGAFGGDVNLALAAYNAGESAVWRHGGKIPPYPETRRYVWRINAAYRRLSGR